MSERPVLYLIIPCFNEEEVLPLTAPAFSRELIRLAGEGKISGESRVFFVDDGSEDGTWDIICSLSKELANIRGIRESRNMGHQNALLAGLMEAKGLCDITITTDCDGQNELGAIERMVDAYSEGNEIVYGVRKDRKSDGFFKRHTAQIFYKLTILMGIDMIYNHADYRLVSSRVLDEFEDFREVNVFLRGMFPLVGFRSTTVEYEMGERAAGRTHYSPQKMLHFAIDGVTSFSIKPVRAFTITGFIVSLGSFIGIICTIIDYFTGGTVSGYASLMCIICFAAGIQLIGTGVIGEYIGKIYMEVKRRPRYIISDRTDNFSDRGRSLENRSGKKT
ncbi:MAG: glycosyltransferase family 2 protein [Bacillota bacterium]|nr:glycosyltransferase family 2 protein [Bacillota bacterium]